MVFPPVVTCKHKNVVLGAADEGVTVGVTDGVGVGGANVHTVVAV